MVDVVIMIYNNKHLGFFVQFDKKLLKLLNCINETRNRAYITTGTCLELENTTLMLLFLFITKVMVLFRQTKSVLSLSCPSWSDHSPQNWRPGRTAKSNIHLLM